MLDAFIKEHQLPAAFQQTARQFFVPIVNALHQQVQVSSAPFFLAINGCQGSGKSTLSKLIAGILEPTSGAILIDGIDIRQIDPADIRKNVGIMLQDSWLFSGTIRENIQMEFNEYDDDYLLKICKVAGVDDFVSSQPQGYELEIKERGVGLSGGQRQTINLARSLLHNPNILLLDEPTSSMDINSEQKLIHRLEKELKDRTVLVVTHRPTVLALVDRLIVIEQGKVVANGPKDDVIKMLKPKRGSQASADVNKG